MSQPISHALSPGARDYLAKAFDCTTFQHLMKLSEPESDTGLNVFEENVRECPDDDTSYDEEIADYITAVKEHREPYDPAEHEIEVHVAVEDGGWEVWICGPGTGGEWDHIYLADGEKPDEAECESLFNQMVTPRSDTQTYYPEKE